MFFESPSIVIWQEDSGGPASCGSTHVVVSSGTRELLVTPGCCSSASIASSCLRTRLGGLPGLDLLPPYQ